MTPEAHKKLSKKMSSLLRHRPRDLVLDADGFTPLRDFLRVVNASETNVREVVRDSDKQRFELTERDGETFIRARYGHSAVPEVSYEAAEPPEWNAPASRSLRSLRSRAQSRAVARSRAGGTSSG